MDFAYDWEAEGDQFSFEDSDRFEDDSLCSWISEPESLCNNWRGWRKQNGGLQNQLTNFSEDGRVPSLVELASKVTAQHIPFEEVEKFYPPFPENLQLLITFWSFPENEEDIRMYSCLANGASEEFQKGEHLYKAKAVKEALQIGFHMSATVSPPPTLPQTKGTFNVAIVFDRRRITHTDCTCGNSAWCAHVVAVCLLRIHQPQHVMQRAPVSESLTRLSREQLQKFAQYLISALPQQILPTAQRLLDELLSSQQNIINTQHGAPDPTAGPSSTEHTTWCLDEDKLHENIKKTLSKFCVPSPVVFSDVNFLSSTAPPAAAEYNNLLRPLRGREPEGMWNLLSIVREMFKRHDSNAAPLLEIITDDILQYESLLLWWFTVKTSATHNSSNMSSMRGSNSNNSAQHASSSLCDEIVGLWRLAALNPTLSPIQRDDLSAKLKDWHIATIDKVRKARGLNNAQSIIKKADIEVFSGFKAAIEACQLTWGDYPLPGVTYIERDTAMRSWKLSFSKYDSAAPATKRSQSGSKCVDPVRATSANTCSGSSSKRSSNASVPIDIDAQVGMIDTNDDTIQNDGGSSSSEGFCENFRMDLPRLGQCSDSDLADDSDVSHHVTNEVEQLSLVSGNSKKTILPHMLSKAPSTIKTVKGDALDSDMSESENHGASAATPNKVVKQTANEQEVVVMVAPSPDPIESHQSSDEYQMYYFDPKKMIVEEKNDKKTSDEPNYFAGMRNLENPQDILFARAEGLHAHGFSEEACKLAKQLAEEMLNTLPDLSTDVVNSSKGKKKKATNNTSSFTCTTLAKAAFLCNVLLEDPMSHHIAFKVGMYGLEMPRQPAANKALEVKLANQEAELVTQLKRIPLGTAELNVIRARAEQLRDEKFRSRGEALLPLMLATFIFDSLCMPATPPVSSIGERLLPSKVMLLPSKVIHSSTRLNSDEKLGFEAAVAALGIKSNVSEADHPLLCESIRRQKGDLAVAMLVHYKDDQSKLTKVMEKLLDKEVHQLYKAPSLASYLAKSSISSPRSTSHKHNVSVPPPSADVQSNPSMPSTIPGGRTSRESPHSTNGDVHSNTVGGAACHIPPSALYVSPESAQSLEYLNLEQNLGPGLKTPSGRLKASTVLKYNSNKDTDSSTVEEDSADYKEWESKFRSSILKSNKRHPHGHMASVDSSAPETTSSDNSPTLVRRQWSITKQQGPPSDSGSSAGSSDSFGSSSSGTKGAKAKARDNESPSGIYKFVPAQADALSRSSTPNLKGARFSKGKRAMPTVPNQPSEALSHFMFELAKTILDKAGGNSSTSLFTHPSANTVHNIPHRALHICAFQIGLYALGLHNCVSPNWLSRTYSSHVSWILGQALEIGSSAHNILIDTWEGHLTPTEVANISDRASRGRDANTIRAAAELALSCLPHAHALNPSEIARALIQCKEQSQEMLERACLAVENAAKGGGVYPEVLFNVARQWYELYEKSVQGSGAQSDNNATAPPGDQQALVPVTSASAAAEQPLRTSPPAAIQVVTVSQPNVAVQTPATVSVHLPYTIQPGAPAQLPYGAPYSYVQTVPQFATHYTQAHIATINGHPAYIHPYPYHQGQPHFNALPGSHMQINTHGAATIFHPGTVHLRHTGTPIQSYTGAAIQAMPGQNLIPGQLAAVQMEHSMANTLMSPSNHGHVHNNSQMHYILSSYRVNMLAMETLGRRVHDDRPHTKFARSPPYGEDVKWALSIAMKLGTSYLQQFCASVVNAVVSPFILQDIALETAHYLSRHNPGQMTTNLRSPILNSLVQKCLQMFIQCTHQRLHHITQTEYDEFVSIVCHARNAFCMTPGGMVQFNELLQSLRRAKSCKKELWTRIVNGLAGNMPQ